MGSRKRKPLRSNSNESTNCRTEKIAKVEDSHDNLKEGNELSSMATNTGKAVKKSAHKEEEDDWEKIEQQQSKSSSNSKFEENDSSDDEDDDDDDEIRLEGNIQHDTEKYTFDFNDMRDEYAEGICVLLRSLIQNPTKAYDLAKAISSQSLVGTVVACEGGSDTFAFATVLPLSKEQDLTSAVSKAVSDGASSAAAHTFLDFFSDSKVFTTGVMLHKRFSNLPIQLVGPLHVNLEQDLGWAQHNHESDDSEQNKFRSMQYIMLLSACSLVGDKGAQDGKAIDVLGSPGLLFEYFEDEIFTQNAISAFLFKPKASSTSLVAAILPIASLKKCVNSLCLLIPSAD